MTVMLSGHKETKGETGYDLDQETMTVKKWEKQKWKMMFLSIVWSKYM